MTWIDELESIFTSHLIEHHNHMDGMVNEIRMFTEFLVYSSFTEDEHTINCPFVDCKWDFKFDIKYQMEYDNTQAL